MEWIDVNDRLPELDTKGFNQSDDVLGFLEDGSFDVVFLDKSMWVSAYGDDFNLPVTHWMTLPEPPK